MKFIRTINNPETADDHCTCVITIIAFLFFIVVFTKIPLLVEIKGSTK